MRQAQMAKQRQHQLNQPQLVEIQVKAFPSQSEQVGLQVQSGVLPLKYKTNFKNNWKSFGNFTAQFPVARLIQAVMDSVPANADVHVEINQNSPLGFEPQIEIQQQSQQSANSTGASANNASTETGKSI